jgi:hypothetical protein
VHGNPDVHAHTSPEAAAQRECGQPGGGAGRRDDVGRTGVYPISGEERPNGAARMRPLGDWAGGDRGIAGYQDSGGSDLVMYHGILVGGLTSDGSGRPTIDIHSAYLEARIELDSERPRPDSAAAPAPATNEENDQQR